MRNQTQADLAVTQPRIIPIILSGGAGTRLWPLSTPQKPKQFLRFGSPHSLIQDTFLRCQGTLFDARPIVVTAEAQRFLVAEALREVGLAADILLEPMGRDSCAAIVAGALAAVARQPDAMVLVLAADHHIPDSSAFAAAVQQAVPAAEQGALVTFGVRPSHPATGYGYILPGDAAEGACRRVAAFVEKPDAAAAARHIANGCLWNSGNFMFRAQAFLDEARRLAPDIVTAVSAALSSALHERDFTRLDAEAFAACPRISVDFAIMEKTGKAAVLPVDYVWSDVGSWDAVAEASAPDAQGNAIAGQGHVLDARNVFLHSEGRLSTVLGCDDVIVVSTPDHVLVMRKGASGRMRDLVSALQATDRIKT